MTDLPPHDHPGRKRPNPRLALGLAAAGLLVVGGVAGTVASHALQPAIEMAPLKPVAIASLPNAGDGIVTIRGRVAETYGNKFVIDDGSARTLVDTGRAGDDQRLAADGASVTVQGRFDRGFVHASFLVDEAGHVTALGPMGGPPRGPHGPPPPRRGDGPPAGGPDAPPPPPPGADNAPPPAPVAGTVAPAR